MFAPLVDAVTGRVSAWKAKNSAAYVTLVDTSGNPYSSNAGLTDAQLRASPVPVSGPASAALALDSTAQEIRDRLPSAFLTPGLLAVDTLGTPSIPRVQATSASAVSITLTSTCRRISMYATQGAWYSISGTATATSHYIAAGERLDLDVPASSTVSVLRETTDGSIRITELV